MPDADLNKTVFISYRREPSVHLALLMFKELTARGYDVFWDVESIGAGKFDEIILKNIEARAHFIVLLTEKSLERCVKRGDWMKREIEYAMSLGRQIIPVMVDGFEFKNSSAYLKGKLKKLPTYNGIPLYYQFFDAGMEKLCEQYLTNMDTGKITPLAADLKRESEQIIEEAMKAPAPTQEELDSEELLLRAYGRKLHGGNVVGAIIDASYALKLQPNDAMAYYRRGIARKLNGDLDGALNDFKTTIQFDFGFVTAFYEIGNIWLEKGNFNKAINFYTEAIRRNPDYTDAYYKRAAAHFSKNQFDKALENYQMANNIFSNEPPTLAGLAITHHALGNGDEARRLWRGLVEQDMRYKDVEWVRGELNWAEPLVDAARKLIGELE